MIIVDALDFGPETFAVGDDKTEESPNLR